MSFLVRDGYQDIPDRDAQVAFLAQWPSLPATRENPAPP
jgi:hypothetical protein